MSKFYLLIVSLLAALCPGVLCAQQQRLLTIEELFRLADQQSKSIATQTTALREADEALREARNGRLPEIDLSLSASYLGDGYLTDRDFGGGMSIPMPHLGNNFAVEASQLIYGGGAVSRGIALARLQQEMASINLEETRSRVRFMLVGFYLDLGKMRNLLEVYDRHIELARTLIEDTRARADEGVALKNDITRFELRIKHLELARLKVKNWIEILNADLVTMLSLDPDTEILPDPSLLDQPLPMEGEAFWQAEAEEDAHALRRSDLVVRMSEEQVGLARADRLPKIAAFAANHFDGPITIEVPVINKNFNYWYAGIGISFKLSSLYKSGKSIKRAKIATQVREQERLEILEQTQLSVKGDYVRYMESFEEVATCEKSLELAQENYAVIDTRYRHDIALMTDMLDAANQRLEAELQLTNARIARLFNLYKLKHTTGNL